MMSKGEVLRFIQDQPDGTLFAVGESGLTLEARLPGCATDNPEDCDEHLELGGWPEGLHEVPA